MLRQRGAGERDKGREGETLAYDYKGLDPLPLCYADKGERQGRGNALTQGGG